MTLGSQAGFPGGSTLPAGILPGVLTIIPRSIRSVSLLAITGAAALLVGCSDSAAVSGQGVIERELADQIGLGELDAECNEPDGLVEGETFTCTATTEGGETIEFLGTMRAKDEFDIYSSNLLTADDVVKIREEGARVLSAEVGAEIAADDITCPDDIVILDDSGDFQCEITDVTTGDVYGLTISTGGIEPGVGVKELFFQITDAPL